MNIYVSGPIRNHKDWQNNFDQTEDFIRTQHLIPAIFGESRYNIVTPSKFGDFLSQPHEQEKLRSAVESVCQFFGNNFSLEANEDSLGMTIGLIIVNHWADVIYVCDAPNSDSSLPNISFGMVAEGALAKRRGLKFVVEKKEKRSTVEKLLKIARSNAQILGETMALILNTETGLLEIVKYTDHPILNDSLVYLAQPQSAEVEDAIYQPFICAKTDQERNIYVVLRLLD